MMKRHVESCLSSAIGQGKGQKMIGAAFKASYRK